MTENPLPVQLEEKKNPRVYFKLFFAAWKWYALSFALCIIAGLAFLRYSTAIYTSEATILIVEDDENVLLIRDVIASNDKFALARKTEAQAVILKSRFLLQRVVKNQDLNIQIFSLTGLTELKSTEAYKDPAFMIYEVDNADSLLYSEQLEFIIEPVSSKTFELVIGKKAPLTLNVNEAFKVGTVRLQLQPNANYKKHWINYKYKVVITQIDQVVTKLQQTISINDEKLEIGVLIISLDGPTPEKNDDIIDGLIEEYLDNSIFEKNKVARTTNDFINERILLIEKELSLIESNGESLKKQNDVLDIDIEYSSILLKQNELDKQIINTEVQLAVVKYVQEYINEEGNKLVPVNLGLVSTPLVKAITAYNTLYIESTQLEETTGIKNPKVQSIKKELTSSKLNLQKSMKSLMLSQRLLLEELESQYALGESKIALLPRYERQQRNIDRHRQIIESLYLFLLQKKEENEIILASTIADGRVIDKAFSSPTPISPNKRIVYVLTLVLGLVIPTIGLYLKSIFNDRVHSSVEFKKNGINLLGTIANTKEKNAGYSKYLDNPTSLSFRTLRVHLNLLLDIEESIFNSILVTSLNSKVGKTFTAINLARSLADIDKKVVVIDMDLRHQNLAEHLNLNPQSKGVSDFVLNETLVLKDILIQSIEFNKLSFISSGTTPPNPSELLTKPRVQALIKEAKKVFNYVIIDARSIETAVDTYLLVQHVDMTLLVSKNGKLKTDQLKTIRGLVNSIRLGNVKVIFNNYTKKTTTHSFKVNKGNRPWYLKGKELFRNALKRN
ncbi:MAG: capsular exopolysaccharide synthesis family protein [Salibacteraceae bacterium]|jgi:capsular exopolysaccharide synthesis family protein